MIYRTGWTLADPSHRRELACQTYRMGAARKLHIPAQYIEVLLDACGGRPHIRSTRVKISEIVYRDEAEIVERSRLATPPSTRWV